jgi:O-6-methylguanine DNA methyltransferase
MKSPLVELFVETAFGTFRARYSWNGLAGLDFPKAGRGVPRAANNEIVSPKIRGWHRISETALKSILAGRKAKKLPPLDWTGKTEFQKSVWREMLRISPGKTKSYGEIAVLVGRPKAVRAVGGACGANPVPVLVPCHRILAANGKIGGYSGGLDWKRRLLLLEGVKL